MSRITVEVSYTDSSCHLHRLDGGEYLTIRPGDVVSPGNAIGGWFARSVTYAGKPRLSLVRISGSDKRRDRSALHETTRGQRGTVLTPGRWLWATSSGAARNGVAHPVTNTGAEDPVLAVCRLVSVSAQHVTVKRVASLPREVQNGGPRSLGYQVSWQYAADREEERVKTTIKLEPSASILVEVNKGGEMTPVPRSVFLCYVEETTTRAQLADVTAKALFNAPADRGLVEAMNDLSAAQSWVAAHFEIEKSARGDCLAVDGEDTQLLGGRHVGGLVTAPQSLTLLVRQWGPNLFEPWFGPEQRAWVNARGNTEETVRYIQNRFVVRAGQRGQPRYLSLNHKGEVQDPHYIGEWMSKSSFVKDRHAGLFPPSVLLDALDDQQQEQAVERIVEGATVDPYVDLHRAREASGPVMEDKAAEVKPSELSEEYAAVELRPDMGASVLSSAAKFRPDMDASVLSSPEQEVPAGTPVQAIMGLVDGDACFPNDMGRRSVLFVRCPRGEVAHVVVLTKRVWKTHIPHTVKEVVGITVARDTDDEMTISSYDPGTRYEIVPGRFNLVRRA